MLQIKKIGMKEWLFLQLLLVSFAAFGQENKSENTTGKMKGFQIGINFSPDVCYRTLYNKSKDISGAEILKERNENELPKFGFTTGVNVSYTIKKYVGIEAGIQYSNKGYQDKILELIFPQPAPDLPIKSRRIDNFHYLDIPIKANFFIGNKKVRFISSVGITTNILLKATITSIYYYTNRKERGTNVYSYDFERVNLSPTVSVGIDYKINNKMNLRIEPTFRYGVLQIINTPLTAYLYSGGINIGYYFGL